MTIMINAREVETDLQEISYEQIVTLAKLNEHPDIVYTVTYSMGRNDINGSVVRGDIVKVKQGMSICAGITDNA